MDKYQAAVNFEKIQQAMSFLYMTTSQRTPFSKSHLESFMRYFATTKTTKTSALTISVHFVYHVL